MLKVVIVEDESKILRMLVNLIDWNSHGFEIVSTARDGISGENTILQLKPDIVITDVRMPGCNGIEMIRRIKEILPDAEFIILSGYRHFEYAHSALSLGVRNYLLKPIDEGKLISILTKIRQSRESLSAQQQQQQAALEEMQIQRNILRNTLVLNLTSRDIFVPEDSLETANQLYCTKFQTGCYQVATMQFDNRNESDEEKEKIFLPQVIELIGQVYAEDTYDCVARTATYDITFIINYDPENEHRITQLHNFLFDQTHSLTEEYGSYSVTAGISLPIDDYRQLKQGYTYSAQALQHSLIDGRDRIIFYDSLPPAVGTHNAKNLFHEQRKLQLLNILSANQPDELVQWLKNFAADISYRDYQAASFYDLCHNIAEEALNYFISIQNMDLDKSELLFYLNSELVPAASIDSLFTKLYEFLLHLIKNFTAEKISNSYKMVQRAQKYIDKNYKNQIRLEDVANAVGLNTTYLCGLFKTEAGITFSEYLTAKRMDEAKKLLRDSSLNIITIAMECGYGDVKYFSKLFSKTVGIRPTEYRALYS